MAEEIPNSQPTVEAVVKELKKKYVLISKPGAWTYAIGNIIVAALTALSSYELVIKEEVKEKPQATKTETHVSEPRIPQPEGADDNDKRTIRFKKKFVFWTPEFTVKQNLRGSKTQKDFHNDLFNKIGTGYTRWKVEGGWKDEHEKGWFYEVATEDEKIQKANIYHILDEYWTQKEWYITEIMLKNPNGGTTDARTFEQITTVGIRNIKDTSNTKNNSNN
jgi:hypothetical protein